MANVNEGVVQTLPEAEGYITGWKEVGGVLVWTATPAADVAAVGVLAASALQPSDVGSAAYLNEEDVVTAPTLDASQSIQDAQIAALIERIAGLEELVGVGGIVILESDILEGGIVN